MRNIVKIQILLLLLLESSMGDPKIVVNSLNSGLLTVDKDDTDLLLTPNGLVRTSSVGDVSVVNTGISTGDDTIIAGNGLNGAGLSGLSARGARLGGGLTGIGPRTAVVGVNELPTGLGSLTSSVQSISNIRGSNSYRPQMRYVVPNRSRFQGSRYAPIHPRRRSRKRYGVRYYKYPYFG